MNLESLHHFRSEDWKALETQFSSFYRPTFRFVTENKGSLSEARDIYIEAFIYYTQLLELRGLDLLEKGESIIYSFARKLWILKLQKRRVDVNFVVHRREFFEMEDAFHDIDLINERSQRTAARLAEVGEPCRTLVTECIGKRTDFDEVGRRLGFSDEGRAFQKITTCLKKLISSTEGKTFDFSDTEFEMLLRYVLDNESKESIEGDEFSKDKKVCLAMLSRVIAVIRSHVARQQRMRTLKEICDTLAIETSESIKTVEEPKTQKKMKPAQTIALAATVAVVISALTAFSISGSVHSGEAKPEVVEIDSSAIETKIIEEERVEEKIFSAFSITNDGYVLTSAEALENAASIKLLNGELSISAQIVAIDTTLNLALLKQEGEAVKGLPFMMADRHPLIGESAYTAGFAGDDFFFSPGNLNSQRDGTSRMKLDISSAGAPVFSEKGQILGLVYGVDESNAFTQMINAEEIQKFIENAEKAQGIQIRTMRRNGLFYDDLPTQIQKIQPFIYRVKVFYS